MTERMRIASLQKLKQDSTKIAMVTAYDYPTGHLADEAGVDVVLVGDSLGDNVLGYETTIPVTLDQMIHHTAAVRRGVMRALLVADMPFMTYKIGAEEALRNAARLIQEGGAEAVKVEGAGDLCPIVRRIVQAGIPVMGHVGLLPQSEHAQSGRSLQGRDPEQARRLMKDARALEEAGCFVVVLETIPWDLARDVTAALGVPTIGIGAGSYCDGQVLILTDLVGLTVGHVPSTAKQYAQVGPTIRDAISAFADEVRRGVFPDAKHSLLSKSRPMPESEAKPE